MLPKVGNGEPAETAECGGRKAGVVELTGPVCLGELEDCEGTRNDRY